MGSLQGKKIVLGITGSIAAYKAAMLLRLFIKAGAEVQVVMTPSAKEFITPTTLAALSQKPVISEFFDRRDGSWHSHVDIGLWADLFVIAPATAATIGKMVHGIADNMLITTYLSMKAPTMVAPAMDLDMFAHTSTQENLKVLRERGVAVVEPQSGFLASQLVGKGRMEEPEQIVAQVERFFSEQEQKSLLGKRVLITAGPTYEHIDPVRFIGNFSTGKMGVALAEELHREGAEVHLVLGPSSLTPASGIKLYRVESALEMLAAAEAVEEEVDLMIFTAAVADYRPKYEAPEKLKREAQGEMTLELVKNPDIAATLGARKRERQFFVGFALETTSGEQEAKRKLKEKNLDLIVLNTLQDEGAGFGVDTNKVSLFYRDGKEEELPLMPKREVARSLVKAISERLG